MVPTFDGGDDFVWVCSPGEWFGVFVGFCDEAVYGSLEIDEGVEDAAVEPPLGEFGEEPIDGVEPRTGCWREVENKPLVAIEPSPDPWMLMGGVEVAFPKILKSEFQLPDFVRRWIDAQFEADISAPAQLVLINTEQQQTLITYIGENGPDEFLIRIIEDNFLARQRCLSEAFGLTMREGEVLVWVANGKSNRDIGIILNLSPRTINKHMERVHRKLGVENRTMAAAMALKIL